MKKLLMLVPLSLFFFIYEGFAQSIEIGVGAEINVGLNSDICATNWGYITGNLTGEGKQCGGVLPVTIASFDANVSGGRNVILKWVTASEINNSGFELQRKASGGVWVKTAWINGRGNSTISVQYGYIDSRLNTGEYSYRLKQIDLNGNSEFFSLRYNVSIGSPYDVSLSQNYPNPSNPVSKIDYQIPFTGKVSLKVYDIKGSEVTELVNESKEPGYYTAKFDGSALSSGVYFYRMVVTGDNKTYSFSKKMLLIK